ncbi:MAG: NAD-dependent epimerase/dehydratase family protein [Myxococcales bacterium]|nr:NAD-dependent epimerase/dehydratase family protein [Myxococcales bacterium]
MHRALVTGGCGFLGSAVVRELLARGVRVRVLAAPGEPRDNLTGLDVEIVEGDVRSVDAVRAVTAEVDTVFHLAAVYQDWAPDPTRMYDVNLRGTFHVLEAARRAGVARVIYTASMVALGRPEPGAVGDERTPYEAWNVDFAYSRSKYFSRELAEYFAAWGLDVRIVCPGIVLGPYDLRPTPSGKLIVNTVRRRGPMPWFDGGAAYVDVRDAAAVHVLVAERGRAGERYLAVAHNLTNLEFIRAIDAAAGIRRRYVHLPVGLARAIGRAMDRRARRTGRPPLLSLDFFEYSLKPSFYSNRKSVEELGARYRPLDETLRDAIAYFRQRGFIPSPP